jgi:hypothetical protein
MTILDELNEGIENMFGSYRKYGKVTHGISYRFFLVPLSETPTLWVAGRMRNEGVVVSG